ncbi:MAG: 5-methyltetrahydrofolate--homocysteine methyltransferase [Bacteroidaceae bacterium]|nr:5-methyltetrahydrofolate--homocysteine methyltransferase [Bacteroidaceae bacterium]
MPSLYTFHYKLHEVAGYVNWLYFFHAWGFPARFSTIAQIHGCDSCRATWLASFPESERSRAAEAMQLYKEAMRMLRSLDTHNQAHVRLGLYECNADGDDIIIYPDSRLTFLRQQHEPFLCLSDFVRPLNENGTRDRIALFAASVDAAMEQQYAPDSDQPDDYRHLLCQTLADRLAEAAVEKVHEEVRRSLWGYAPNEHLSIADLHAERFQGIRPAVGYPSMPDQSLNFVLDSIIDFSSIGIDLTEHGAMRPHASVSGLMISHPDACYFSIGKIGEDQLYSYASRRGMAADTLRSYLTGNL